MWLAAGFATPNLSDLEFAHMLSRDEGDVGDVFSDSSDDDEADMSDTQAEIGSASSDNANLPELDDEVRPV